jgi:maspardin
MSVHALPPADFVAFRQCHHEKTVTVEGRTWRYVETSGTGPALILLPGAQGNGEIFYHQLTALGGQLRMVAALYPAEADSTVLADSLAAFMTKIGVTRGSLLGTSFGGYMAQVFALRHPERIDTLFLANTFADPSAAQARGRPRDHIAATDAEQMRKETLERLAMAKLPTTAHVGLNAILRDIIGQQPAEYIKARTLGVANAVTLPRLPLSDDRIVLIECADDPVIDAPTRLDLRQRYPSAEQHTLPSGGHFPACLLAEGYTNIIAMRLCARSA